MTHQHKCLVVLVGFSSMLASGCLSRHVLKIGTRPPTIVKAEAAIMASDGSVALETRVMEQNPTVRYFYRDGDSISQWLAEGLVSGRRLQLMTEYESSGGPNLSCTSPTEFIFVKRGSPKANNFEWKMIPDNRQDRDGTRDQLPSQFSSTSMVRNMSVGTQVPYESKGKKVNLCFAAFPLKNGRAWWSYPIQVLLVPAAIIDGLAYAGGYIYFVIRSGGHLTT